ncbi:MAG TPA: carboxypeptidase regulatory-like domain-containing protein [Methylomirabilota bacterium]|nr:carboxypeptidase regulatory-like domain-containing protein [Methylomirabilota bacterium]
MKHLTDEQLSALLDDALAAGERAACDAHLADCEACRTRLAEASALEGSLGKALTHDPGEGYFADFAERVAKRIADRRLDVAPEAPKKPWLFTPRGWMFAGSTAALLVTAGLAWMQFHNEQNVVRAVAPRPMTQLREQVTPRESDGAQAEPPAQAPTASTAPAPTAAEERARNATPNPAAAGSQLTRMHEVRTLPDGRQVPVDRSAPGANADSRQEPSAQGFAAPATGSAIAQMKKKSVTPAAEAGAPVPFAAPSGAPARDKDEKEELQASSEAAAAPAPAMKTAPPAANAPRPAAALSQDTARGQSLRAWGTAKSLVLGGRADGAKLNLSGLGPHCGKVHDSRGRALAGVQVTAVQNGVRTTRTDAEGSFCIDGLKAGDTLSVMHVGFDPYTVVVTPSTSLAITLEPVGTLGPNSTMLMGKQRSLFSDAAGTHTAAPSESLRAPSPDVYSGQSFGVRQLVRDARDVTSVARRERTAPRFEQAAKQWAAVLGQVKGAPADDARFQYVSALREAYHLEPTRDREARFRSAITAFLALAPATLPERATVTRWEAELNGASGR